MRGRPLVPLITSLLFAGLLGVGAADVQGPRELDPASPYRAERSDPVTHTVDFAVVVTPPYQCQVLKVWLPVPVSDAAQEVIGRSEFSTFPAEVTPQLHTEPVYGNRFAYFEFKNPHGAQIIHHKFKVKIWELNWNLDPKKVQTVRAWPEAFAPYRRPPKAAEQEEFQRLLKTIVPEPGNPGADLFRVMKWIDRNLTYDHASASLKADAAHALDLRRGHCSDYHGLCAVMGQALGYPTRVTYGLALYPRNSPSHCRVEAYLPPYGWVSFDLSETQQMVKRIHEDATLDRAAKERLATAARERLLRGFRENSWLLMTKGTNYQLVPKAVAPVPVVRTAYVEADGEVLPDPDPANAKERRFAWMTAHRYTADRPFRLPFKDYRTLEK